LNVGTTVACVNGSLVEDKGGKKMKPDAKPPEAPAPHLPNIPMSSDDPFQPDIERREPVTPQPDETWEQPTSGHTRQKKEAEEELE
jgi:hypothetical protein